VQVDRSRREPGGLDDVGHRGALKALDGEAGERGGRDLLAAGLPVRVTDFRHLDSILSEDYKERAFVF
jgi:hypothetical protein